MGRTYVIMDGVRRAKAADLSGHETIWAEVGYSRRERKVAVRALLSPKAVIDLREPRQLERWRNIRERRNGTRTGPVAVDYDKARVPRVSDCRGSDCRREPVTGDFQDGRND